MGGICSGKQSQEQRKQNTASGSKDRNTSFRGNDGMETEMGKPGSFCCGGQDSGGK